MTCSYPHNSNALHTTSISVTNIDDFCIINNEFYEQKLGKNIGIETMQNISPGFVGIDVVNNGNL